MTLQMQGECTQCHLALARDAEAYICMHECTFCPDCSNAMTRICPNCGGELVRRPRPAPERKPGQAAA